MMHGVFLASLVLARERLFMPPAYVQRSVARNPQMRTFAYSASTNDQHLPLEVERDAEARPTRSSQDTSAWRVAWAVPLAIAAAASAIAKRDRQE